MTSENASEQSDLQGLESTTAKGLDKDELMAKVPGLIANLLPGSEIATLPLPANHQGKAQIDLFLELKNKDHLLRLAIKVQPLGYPSRISRAINSFKQMPESKDECSFIVTDQISNEGALLARQAGIGYLDLVGNCHLDFKGLSIKKTAEKRTKRTAASLQYLFSPKATRVIRTLIEFGSKSWPVVELARLSNVSVGYAYKVARKLAESGFAQEEKARVQLREPFKLLNLWAQEYRILSSQITSFLYPDGTAKQWALRFADEAKQQGFEFALTLDTAASLLASHDFSEPVYLYASKPIQDPLWSHLGLKPAASGGTIHILEPYDRGVFHYRQIIQEEWPVVSQSQLYLDLFQKPSTDNKVIEFFNTLQMQFEGKPVGIVQKPIIKEEDCSWRLILSKAQKAESKQTILGFLTQKLKLSLPDAQSIFKSRPIILFDQKSKQEVEAFKLIFRQAKIETLLSNNLEDEKTLPRVRWSKTITQEDFK